MMKKAIKKLLAALLAVAMVCAMAIPAFASNSWETEEDLNTKHEYAAFQIFTGDVKGNNIDDFKISNANWGESIPDHTGFLEKLTEDPTIGGEFKTNFTPQEAVAVISQWGDSDDNSIAFARCVCNYLYSNGDPKPVIQGLHTGGIKVPKPGYYLIVDTSPFDEDDSYHAYNSFLLKVTKADYVFNINYKVVKPTVEKEVHDNDNNDISSAGNNDGWGSSADHAINEKFQFRLIAKLPASKDNGRAYDYYKKYTVCFNDTLSDGITFDKLDKVEIANGDGSTSQVIDAANYTRTPNGSQSFKLSIDNVKTCARAANLDLNKGATITVTYTAHLNETAYVNTAGGDTKNKNSVYLQYSNNPRIDTSLDHTHESEVCVYTYQLNNTKLAETENGTPLPGAGFKLYSDADCKNEVNLYQKDNFYFPIKDATDKKAVEMMISGQDGQFNVRGLDAGTYYLKETKTPDDYSTCPDKEIVISATHNVYNVSLAGNLSNKIINKKAGGITLPSTGGIGTTLFYVVGGGLMVAAIVLLVTKKRMENK
ncbi:LPXTG-motif cell wall anchor domain protein [Faecalibacterium cf. prausnitzii KLE1255]|uniref:LPXTG-motif cell wall anchor domain protein n=1 Tax=Faecalibacterium cf. prausnitzii KLE1255 TaxID=748224 RepID=E2ZM80_9FIRM|nr:SpaH/EbpB family LPXTG-anchored major pilin [Faecalibacterium prausnitzii]EFQ05707.1 LPXTG-motif cell wall anchor domain protein [Faecalibacterium cf. prausnitzii KLE1255]